MHKLANRTKKLSLNFPFRSIQISNATILSVQCQTTPPPLIQ